MNEPKYLLDARWIGVGGAGRVTENLLTGLSEIQPEGQWMIWGPVQCSTALWPGATWVPSRHSPVSSYAQREWRSMRQRHADVAFFVHQIRPMMKVAPVEVTLIHDTIGIRFPTKATPSFVFRETLRRAAALSTIVATVSEYSRQCIVDDLGVDDDRIRVLAQPIDRLAAARVRDRRTREPRTQDALYIGRDAPHKNLDRAVEAFARTNLQRDGGSLVLVGVGGRARRRLASVAQASGARLRFPGIVSQTELENLMTRCAVVVQPSIEEGFGLPTAEALAAGIPVAASSAGALREILRGSQSTFDPFDVAAMARAIDLARSATTTQDLCWPTPSDLARSALAAISDAVATPSPVRPQGEHSTTAE